MIELAVSPGSSEIRGFFAALRMTSLVFCLSAIFCFFLALLALRRAQDGAEEVQQPPLVHCSRRGAVQVDV